jgi:hypothetical protein
MASGNSAFSIDVERLVSDRRSGETLEQRKIRRRVQTAKRSESQSTRDTTCGSWT